MQTIPAGHFPDEQLDPAAPTGLLLCGMGGPDGPDSVAPFLRHLFDDPMILPLPRWLSRPLGELIALRRVQAVRRRYRAIDPAGASPQRDWTQRQAETLARRFENLGTPMIGEAAMRYWHPFADESVSRLAEAGVVQFLVVPAYPQYASATSGSVLREVIRAVDEISPGATCHVLTSWHLNEGYVSALVKRAAEPLRSWAAAGEAPETCGLLFVAHSLPKRFIDGGDPYLQQLIDTVAAVASLLPEALSEYAGWWHRIPSMAQLRLAFQSRVGPLRWLGPEVKNEVRALANEGCRRLAIVPVSFTCEHIETLHELDIELARLAADKGITEFHRAPALNLDTRWLDALAAQLQRDAFASSTNRRQG